MDENRGKGLGIRDQKDEAVIAWKRAGVKAREKRLRDLVARHGIILIRTSCDALQRYAKRMMEVAISEIPRKIVRFSDSLDGGILIQVAISRKGKKVLVDFSGSSPQVDGNTNAVYAVTLSAVLYCFRCIVREDIPLNATDRIGRSSIPNRPDGAHSGEHRKHKNHFEKRAPGHWRQSINNQDYLAAERGGASMTEHRRSHMAVPDAFLDIRKIQYTLET